MNSEDRWHAPGLRRVEYSRIQFALPAPKAIAGCIPCPDSHCWFHYLHLQLLLVALPALTAATGCIVSHTLWENKLAVCIDS